MKYVIFKMQEAKVTIKRTKVQNEIKIEKEK